MKRILLSVMIILFSLGVVFSQNASQNPVLNIKGVFKTDYLNITKGTPTVLQRIIKSQIPAYNSKMTNSRTILGGRINLPNYPLIVVFSTTILHSIFSQ